MKYLSTRGGDTAAACEAIVNGLARDGGLYVPERYYSVSQSELEQWCTLSYTELAERILRAYIPDFSLKQIAACVQQGYASFESKAVTPITRICEGQYVLELFHGPTSAFKDVALQVLPRLMQFAQQKHDGKDIMILTATSGDTGKAALQGFAGVPGTHIMVFYPKEGVAEAQRIQMVRQQGDNAYACAVEGNFDDAQRGVKSIFGNAECRDTLLKMGLNVSSANSINWGRLLPQIVYYFYAYAQLIKSGALRAGECVRFVVPTGNFGNILAGYYAKRMGLPIEKLVCASNKNNVLTDFFTTGEYDSNRTFYRTISPSMDILVSSNLERLLFELSGRDAAPVRKWMSQLSKEGRYVLPQACAEQLRADFLADCCDDAQTRAAIKACYEQYGVLMDPHTAVGYAVSQRVAPPEAGVPTVMLSTASPFKFCDQVLYALNGVLPSGDEFALMRKLAAQTGRAVPARLMEMEMLPDRFNDACAPQDMWEQVLAFANQSFK